MSHQGDEVRELLASGGSRGLGNCVRVVELVERDERAIASLVESMDDTDCTIAARAADVLEEATEERPELLAPYKKKLLAHLRNDDIADVRWHIAQMIPRLSLTVAERKRALAKLEEWMAEGNAFVRVAAMQSAVDIAAGQRGELERLLVKVDDYAKDDASAAVRARARRLVRRNS